jgi:nucleoside-specific outer membrane channel protein Tsx
VNFGTVMTDCHIGGDISPIDVNHNSTSILVGRESAVQLQSYAPNRGLLYFDLSTIPVNATITAATLQLYQFGHLNAPAAKIYRIGQTGGVATPAWGESTATWAKYNGVTNWATAGGDFDLTTPTPVDFAVSGTNGFVSFNVRAHAQDAYANRSKQLHMFLKLASDITANIEYAKYYSRDFTSDTSRRPKLTVSWEVAA